MPIHTIAFQNDFLSPSRDRVRRREAPLPILSVGRDRTLLRVREEIITSRSDLRVRSFDPEQAEMAAHSSEARLWVFCFSIEMPRLVYLACSIRRYSPGSRLLLLSRTQQPAYEHCLFHRVIHVSDDVEEFLDAVSDLVLET